MGQTVLYIHGRCFLLFVGFLYLGFLEGRYTTYLIENASGQSSSYVAVSSCTTYNADLCTTSCFQRLFLPCITYKIHCRDTMISVERVNVLVKRRVQS